MRSLSFSMSVLNHIEMRGMRQRLETHEVVRLYQNGLEAFQSEADIGWLSRTWNDVRACSVRTYVTIYGQEVSIGESVTMSHILLAESVRRMLLGCTDEEHLSYSKSIERLRKAEIDGGIDVKYALIDDEIMSLTKLIRSQLSAWMSAKVASLSTNVALQIEMRCVLNVGVADIALCDVS